MDTTVICIVPVRNEEWIIGHFIESALGWADQIIIGDHNSNDRTAEIARKYNSVKVISLANQGFDEAQRRKPLIHEARKIEGRRLIISIDADEMISANWKRSPEWEKMCNSEPGTHFTLDWVQLLPGGRGCFMPNTMDVAFVDDGAEYVGKWIHSPRIPENKDRKIKLNDIKLLHFISIDENRVLSKHRWYKVVEYAENDANPWDVCVRYQDSKLETYDNDIVNVKSDWIENWEWIQSIGSGSGFYWYDGKVLGYMDEYGTQEFKKLNIWYVDWTKKASIAGMRGDFSDPRSLLDKLAHRFISKNRAKLKARKSIWYKIINKLGRHLFPIVG